MLNRHLLIVFKTVQWEIKKLLPLDIPGTDFIYVFLLFKFVVWIYACACSKDSMPLLM